jgi:hypothetical protein
MGTPPGLTAVLSESITSGLPVCMPSPGPRGMQQPGGRQRLPRQKSRVERAAAVGVLNAVERAGRGVRDARREVDAADEAHRPRAQRRLVVGEERRGPGQRGSLFVGGNGLAEVGGRRRRSAGRLVDGEDDAAPVADSDDQRHVHAGRRGGRNGLHLGGGQDVVRGVRNRRGSPRVDADSAAADGRAQPGQRQRQSRRWWPCGHGNSKSAYRKACCGDIQNACGPA